MELSFQQTYTVNKSFSHSKDKRPAAIIKIWNPETEKRKVPKFLLELFLETFQETKISCPEKKSIFMEQGSKKKLLMYVTDFSFY